MSQNFKKGIVCLDDDVRAQIQESHNRAKYILETSKRALNDQAKQLGANRIDISNLFGNHSLTLPTKGSPDHHRRSVSPAPSFNPITEDMHSTRRSMGADDSATGAHQNNHRHRESTPTDMRSARPKQPSQHRSRAHEMSVNNILAGSRSERVRRLSNAPNASRGESAGFTSANKARFEQDERDFIAEIPDGFQANSPPTCEAPAGYSDSARIPIEIDDFGGRGYLLKNDYSFNQMCNKASNRPDSICLPMEEQQRQRGGGRSPNGRQGDEEEEDSFYSNREEQEINLDSFKRVDESAVSNGRHSRGCKLLGGDVEGVICLDCSNQCNTTKPNKDKCKVEIRESCEGASMQQKTKDCCKKTIEECCCQKLKDDCNKSKDDFCKKVLDKVACCASKLQAKAAVDCCAKKEVKKKKKDYCDQHLNYLDSVMKSLDVDHHRNNINCCNDVKAVSARKYKSLTGEACCSESKSLIDQFYGGFGRKSGGSSNCCSEDLNEKAMSVCSQPFSSNGDSGLGRAFSQMSSSSDFNFINGYLPLKSTHNELSWPSVRLRQQQSKSFQIKNTSEKRLIVRVILDGPGFNFQNPEANAKGTLTLRPMEIRTMTLIFNPTVLGPAIGNLIFQPPIEYCAGQGTCATMSNINSRVTKRVIRLYGYGGHVSMSFERLQQGPVGHKFLPLGNLCNLSKVFEETFIIRNKGNLTGFAAVMLENKTVGKSMFDQAITVCPDKVLIEPNSSVKIKVSFAPTGSDMKEMMKIHREAEVIAVGNVLVVTGDEPTRCRVKRLINMSQDLANKYSSAQLRNIWGDYGTSDCDYDLSELRETGLAVADLIGSFSSKEVSLTVNNSVTDMSLIDASGWISDMEDQEALFHTICQPNENSECCRSPPEGDLQMMPLETKCQTQEEDPCNPDEWHVEPSCLSFDPGSVLPKVLTIYSKVSKDRMFEVDSNVANYFCVLPQEGVIRPSCCKTNVSVRMLNYNVPPTPLYIYIYIENDRICVPVTIEQGPEEGRPTCPKISSAKVANLA